MRVDIDNRYLIYEMTVDNTLKKYKSEESYTI